MDLLFSDFISGTVPTSYKIVCIRDQRKYIGPNIQLPVSGIHGLIHILNNNLVEWDVTVQGYTLVFMHISLKYILLDHHFYSLAIMMKYYLDVITHEFTPPANYINILCESTVLFRAINSVINSTVQPKCRYMNLFTIKIYGDKYCCQFKGYIMTSINSARNALADAFMGWLITLNSNVITMSRNLRNIKEYNNTRVLDAVVFLNRF